MCEWNKIENVRSVGGNDSDVMIEVSSIGAAENRHYVDNGGNPPTFADKWECIFKEVPLTREESEFLCGTFGTHDYESWGKIIKRYESDNK